VFKLGLGFPEAGPYVAEGLASLITDVVGGSVAGAVDAVLTTDLIRSCPAGDAYWVGQDGLL